MASQKTNKERIANLIAVARGDRPADLIVRRATLLNIFNGTTQQLDIAVAEGKIAYLSPSGGEAEREIDASGLLVIPGLIDSHVHIESSMLWPGAFGYLLASQGVTTAICDPHEVANVAGAPGVLWMMEAATRSPSNLLFTLPSSVPASELATTGSKLGPEELSRLASHPKVVGLGELMCYPEVVAAAERPLAILSALNAPGAFHVDGHAPGLTGRHLQAYRAAGPSTDHECTTPKEVNEKLALGFHIMLREGTRARNAKTLAQTVTQENERFFSIASDDRDPRDILQRGHIGQVVSELIKGGMRPLTAVRLATINAARLFGLRDRGAIFPGAAADLVALETISNFQPVHVIADGNVIVENGKIQIPHPIPPKEPIPNARMKTDPNILQWPHLTSRRTARIISLVGGELLTKAETETVTPNPDGLMQLPEGCALVAVLERHTGSGRAGYGLVRGLGQGKGALASSVCHDHHNIIVAGTDLGSMKAAAAKVAASGGGLVAAYGERIEALPLPLAGLMSTQNAYEAAQQLEKLEALATDLGWSPGAFSALSFLGLEVIPELRVTDLGLVDSSTGTLVPLFI